MLPTVVDDAVHEELAAERDGGDTRRCFAAIHQPCHKLIALEALGVGLQVMMMMMLLLLLLLLHSRLHTFAW